MALDLSARASSLGSKPPSPTASLCSEGSLGDRPSSAYSDSPANDSDEKKFSPIESSFSSAMGTPIKPIPGPLPTLHTPSPSFDAGKDKFNPNSRPFKMYPMEGMPDMNAQMAASAASLSLAGMYNPFAGGAATGVPLPGMGLMDNPISLSSPITQYIQQKKRRAENRKSYKTEGNTDYDSPLPKRHKQDQAASPPFGTPQNSMENGHTSDEFSGQNQKASTDELREMCYWDRRKKNNEAAKRSRDVRRMKEEEIALRAAFLEQENLKLRAQVSILKGETAKLHYMLYNRL